MRFFVIDFKTLVALVVLVVSSFALADGVTYTYDSLGRITGATYASGAAVQYAYDANGNRTTLSITAPVIQPQTISFGAAPNRVVGGTGTVSATGGASGNLVTFTSQTTGVCTISGSIVTGITAGSCTIAANQAGNATYSAAPQANQSFNIGMGSQTIGFGSAPTVSVGGIGTVSATGGASGNAVTFTSQTTGVCTISGSIVTGVTAGVCTIAANQAGNTNYGAAPQVTQTYSIGKGNQTISFGTAPTVVVGGIGTVSATGGASGNQVTFSSTTTGVCTISGSTVTGLAFGTCTIAANQAGSTNYNAATQTTLSFNIGVATLPGKIIFVSNRNGNNYEIYQKDLSTGNIINLSNNPANDMNPEISSDGRWVVFYSDRAKDKNNNPLNQIYKLDLQNLNQVTRLTNDGASDYDPAFMPDGRILFKSNYNDGLGDIWIINSDGSNAYNLTPSLSKTEESKPDPISNTQIVFSSRLQQGNPNSDEVFTLNISTGALTRITTNNVPDWYPAVDPSGSRIAFISKENQSDPDAIYTMTTDGQNRVRLTDPTIISNDSGDPSWSPDGQSIIFINSKLGNYNVYIMDNKGGNISALEIAPSGVDLSPLFVPSASPLPFNQLTISNSGFGTVISDVGSINCGATCKQNFVSGMKVTLTAIPVSGYQFTGWGGACRGYGNSCTVITTNAAQTVTANFAVFKVHQPLWKRAIGSIVKKGG